MRAIIQREFTTLRAAIVLTLTATTLTVAAATPIPLADNLTSHAHHAAAADSSAAATGSFLGFFTNNGNDMPRIHCLTNEAGNPDWPWIAGLLGLNALILAGYTKIVHFWFRAYTAEKRADRNKKLWYLALIFIFCGLCGYGMSIVMFFWPAYRLLGILMAGLVAATWFFAWNLKPFTETFAAQRIEREKQEAAEHASQTKSEFLANMSHEIRTPMTAILGYLDILDDEHEANLTAQQQEKLAENAIKTIRVNANHLLVIINDILDMSKIEAGQMKIEKIESSPCQIIEETVSLARPNAAAKGIEIKINYETPIPASITTDPTRLRQVLLNLTGNAIKFTHHGAVTIHAACDRKTHRLSFRVEDTGIGMTPDQLETIRSFKAFAQADSSTTRKFGGTGLGLRISNSLINMLGGELTIASVHGQGSTFAFEIDTGDISDTPVISVEQAAARPRRKRIPHIKTSVNKEPEHPLAGVSILLAEDGIDNQRLIAHHLKKAGATVKIVDNGQDAVDTVRSAHTESAPDLVLMDMQMPILDGYAASAALRSSGHSIPIIALTAHAMMGDRQRCLAAGCSDYLTKPINKAALITTCNIWAHAPARAENLGRAA